MRGGGGGAKEGGGGMGAKSSRDCQRRVCSTPGCVYIVLQKRQRQTKTCRNVRVILNYYPVFGRTKHENKNEIKRKEKHL